jgi:hypothetical protein
MACALRQSVTTLKENLMTSLTDALPGGAADAVAVPVSIPMPANDQPISVREAGRALSDYRVEQRSKERDEAAEATAPESGAPAERDAASANDADSSETDSSDAAPDSQDPGATATPDPADMPPIEPPRSWTAAEKERFKSLPRETQEYLATREQDREREFRRGQNEAATLRKALDGDRQQLEQARARYETALPALLQTLQVQQAGAFADIRSMADVEKLAREDYARYAQWDAQQKKIAAVMQEVQATQARQQQDHAERWSAFARRQDELFAEQAPEAAEGERSAKLRNAAVDVLRQLGFSDGELAQLWNGERDISLRDHRLQLLIRDGVQWREAQAKAKTAAKKPLPPVQRPGVAQGRAAAQEAQVNSLTKRLDQSGSLKDAAALLRARRA